MKILSRLLMPGLVTSFLIAGASARADEIIFSNLGPGPLNTGGITIRGADADPGVSYGAIANRFTSPDVFTLTSIDVALTWLSGVNGVTLSLEDTDINTNLPGQILETWDLTSLPTDGETTHVAVNSVQTLLGANYWLVATPDDPTTVVIWERNDQNKFEPVLLDDGTGWQNEDASLSGGLQVSGDRVNPRPIPEIDPNSAATAVTMLVGGFLALAGRRTKFN